MLVAQTETGIFPIYFIDIPLILHSLISLALVFRIVTRRKDIAASLAWISLVIVVPYVGLVLYLLFGELRLGRRRERRINTMINPYKNWIGELAEHYDVDWSAVPRTAQALDRLASKANGAPTLPGNKLELTEDNHESLRAMIRETEQARETIDMEFYIWSSGGIVDEMNQALIAAKDRGVRVRLLLDSVGSNKFLKSDDCERMRRAGLEIVEALPAGIFRSLFRRQDLRLHRKIAVFDNRIGFTGSINMADALYFKQNAGVGQWVDVLVRVEGPAVEVLSTTFLADWDVETNSDRKELSRKREHYSGELPGNAYVQVVPSGPGYYPDSIYHLLLATIYSAHEEIILTTPYFVPDDALHVALRTAALRGVKVTLVIPEKNDSKLVTYACRSHFDSLLEAGVRIMRFTGGLLHTKSIVIDRQFCLVGSVNLDMRSLWLNHELTLFIYNHDFTERVRYMQHNYLSQSEELDVRRWEQRSGWQRLLENLIRLMSPVL